MNINYEQAQKCLDAHTEGKSVIIGDKFFHRVGLEEMKEGKAVEYYKLDRTITSEEFIQKVLNNSNDEITILE